jgi:2-alkenal reductase
VVIDRVFPGSAAEAAGLSGIDYQNRLLGDVIVGADGKAVDNLVSFSRIIKTFDIGDTIVLEIRRGDRVRNVEVRVMDIS